MTKHFVSSNTLKVQKKLILGWSHSVVHIVTIHLPIEVLWNNMNELTLPLWDISCYTFSSWMASHQYESFHVSLSDLFVKCLVKMWTYEWLLASVILSSFFILLESINVLLQCEQWNGFWPVWVIPCCLNAQIVKYFGGTWKDPHWHEAIQLFTLWQDICQLKCFESTWQNSNCGEAIQLFILWQDICTFKYF